MNHLYVVSIILATATLAVGLACRWAQMSRWRTIAHVIAAPVLVPAIAFTVYFAVTMPLALIGVGAESLVGTNIDPALETTGKAIAGILFIGFSIAYFREEKSFLKSAATAHSRQIEALKNTPPRKRVRFPDKSIVQEYREIRAKKFATGTVYVLPKQITYPKKKKAPHRTPHDLRASTTTTKLFATARPKPSRSTKPDSRFSWRSLES
ncbi:MAG: hypothetical protein AAF591_03725 [Verrucomicrobiota bacterium]